MVGLGLVGDAYAAYVMTTRGPPDTLAVVGAWAQGWFWYLLLSLALIYLPLLFPDSRLPSRRWLPVAVLAGIRTLGMVLLGMLTDTLRGTIVGYKIDNPIGIGGKFVSTILHGPACIGVGGSLFLHPSIGPGSYGASTFSLVISPPGPGL